jgi:cytochrome c553
MSKYLKMAITASLLVAAAGVQAGDAAAGKSKGMKCISCHGLKGVSSNPQYPNIAGQKEAFLIMQMEAFKSGGRSVAAKSALFGGLTSADFADLAAHFTALPAGSAGSKADAAVLAKGKAGNEVCASCHGANGEGTDQGPRLAGQNSAYLVKRLNDYKSGAAKDENMKPFADALSNEDMAAISEYLASLN